MIFLTSENVTILSHQRLLISVMAHFCVHGCGFVLKARLALGQQMNTHTRTHARTHERTQARARARARKHASTHARTHARTLIHSLTHTHTRFKKIPLTGGCVGGRGALKSTFKLSKKKERRKKSQIFEIRNKENYYLSLKNYR